MNSTSTALRTETYQHPGLERVLPPYSFTFREDGYFCMTGASQVFGKELKQFFKTKETKAYIEALSQLGGIAPNKIKEASKGRYGQTFCHPKLGIRLAQWLDVRFAVWCDLMIDNILKGNLQVTVAVPTEEALALKPPGIRYRVNI